MPSPEMQLGREALYLHLQELGISPAAASLVLVRIDSEAQAGHVPENAIVAAAGLAADPEAVDKALSLLKGYAELRAFGAPITQDFAPQGVPAIGAASPLKDFGPDEMELPGLEPRGSAEPKVGGTCLTCPNYDFGVFTPVTVYQTHASSLVPGVGDCAWYAFNVVAGNRYEFTLCNAPGSAAWDSVLEIYDPVTSCGTFLAKNDDCSTSPVIRQSTLLWDATFTGVAHLKLRGFSSTVGGTYILAYRNLGIVCETCANPNPVTLASAGSGCQCVSGSTDANCPSDYYVINLVAGESYRFTTCPAECASATASFDTKLRVWSPSCGFLIENDDACTTTGLTTRSTLNFTATVSGPHVIQITGRTLTSGSVLNGTYTMCWKRTSASCASCAAGPYLGTFTPLPTCLNHSGTVAACQDNWYQFVLTAGAQYEWSTCNTVGGCTTGTSTFDSIIDLHDSGCTMVATDDDSCGAGRSKLVYTVPTGGGGVYKLHVRGKASATGSYTLTYRQLAQACVPPTTLSIAPNTGNTGATNCSRTEIFAVSVDGSATLPMRYSWSIAPPLGGIATPSSGTVNSSAPAGAATFSSTLTREGTFAVTVTASNDCGSVTRTINYILVDNVRPTVTPPASVTVECTSVPGPGTPTVRDNCDPNPAVSFTQTTTPGTCPGNYVIRRQWVATDRSGNVSNPAVQIVTVRDRTPPVVTPDIAVKYCIYPPNHDVVCFDRTMFSPTVTDNCSNPVVWRFARITSSEEGLEPCGDGNQNPDVFVAADGQTFCVRSERCGNDPAMNDGRRYLVEATATDACGNTSAPMPIGFVLVPHDSADTSTCIYPTPIPLP